jgi:hypothetical protein
MAQVFKMSDLGLLRYYLGIEVKQGPEGISLCQGAYAVKIMKMCGLADCNPNQAPMENRLKLSNLSEAAPVDKTLYRSVVGSLRYLVNTRLDIGFVVGYVRRFLEDLREDHMADVKHIVRYIAGTYSRGLWFSQKKGKEAVLAVYSDSAYAGNMDKRKSTGVISFLSCSPVSWQSMKQKVVVQSSCEAEYIAAANPCQALWLSRVMAEILGTISGVPQLKVDNKSAIVLIKNPVLSGQSRHIKVKYHLVHESAARGLISVDFIGTEHQLGDILTNINWVTELRGRIGLIDVCKQHKRFRGRMLANKPLCAEWLGVILVVVST